MADVRSAEVASQLSCVHDVFLSFRGEDTRKAFTDHLYAALVRAGVHTFRDNEGIERGENIKSELERAIMQSRCSIIVFSENYCSSSWCLDELVIILERKRKDSRHVILPIFYHVDPSHVRKQKGSVANAFAVHKTRKDLMEKVKGWRDALREVADLGGMPLENMADGHESMFIQKVVRVIREKLKRTMPSVSPDLVGIESRVKNINLWLQDGSTEVGIMALCGMGGIGKTTIAKYVFNLNSERFEASSFLADIREVSRLPDGLIRLQTQLLSDISKGEKKEIWNVHQGTNMTSHYISCKKVFLVLDDMDRIDQFEAILGLRDSLHPGSKIIITTRHKRLLPHGSFKIHDVDAMGFDESVKLFSWHAFGQDYPYDAYADHSERVVMHCGGLPLALKVVAASLCGREVHVWNSTLEKLESIPNHDIFEKLLISYDSLPDDHDKNLFLEIACFFLGKDKDYVVTILDGCGFWTIAGIENLVDRCLLAIDSENKLTMHQMVRDMGKEVIRRESPEAGKRTRLWRYMDSFHVLFDDAGTETITGLALDMKMVKEDSVAMSKFSNNSAKRRRHGEFEDRSFLKRLRFGLLSWKSVNTASMEDDVYLTTDAFTRMRKLRLLQMNYTQLIGGYEEFPKNLKWLCWRGFSKQSVPVDFPLESLVAIDMRNSRLKQFLKGNQILGFLKILNLSHSHELTTTPNFSLLPELKQLILEYCVSLVEVHESIGILETKLVILNLKECRKLRNLPRDICKLKVLETLVISGCMNLGEFPKDMRKMESLKVFHADRVTMSTSASTTSKDGLWPALFSTWVSRPRSFPTQSRIFLPHCLVSLRLSGCNLNNYSFPIDFSNLQSLKSLDLSRNPLCSFPDSVRGLNSLEDLTLDFCKRLQELTFLPGIKFYSLKYCTSLEKLTFQSNISEEPYVYIVGCKNLVEMERHFKLETIGNLDDEVMKTLGLYHYDLHALNSFELNMYNWPTHGYWKGPIQVLFQNGVTNIFLRGGNVPECFNDRSEGSSKIFITVPPPPSSNTSIMGLNVCVVYNRDSYTPPKPLYIEVCNRTKDLEFSIQPVWFALPKPDEDVIWSSHWKFRQIQLDVGDRLKISAHCYDGFTIKEFGVRVVYGEQAHSLEDFILTKEQCFKSRLRVATRFS